MINSNNINSRRNRPKKIGKSPSAPVYFAVPKESADEPEDIFEKKLSIEPKITPEELKAETASPLEHRVYKPHAYPKTKPSEPGTVMAEKVGEGTAPALPEPKINLAKSHDAFDAAYELDAKKYGGLFASKKKVAEKSREGIIKRFGKGKLTSFFFYTFLFSGLLGASWAISNAPALLAGFSLDVKSSGITSLSPPAAQAGTPSVEPEYVGGPDKMMIPAIGVDAPVVLSEQNTEQGILKDLESGITHYGNTPLPGQSGNAVFFGHSSNFVWAPGAYKHVFATLSHVKAGDQIIIHYAGKKYVYKVKDVKVTSPADVNVLSSTDLTPTITLITCTPTGTTFRRLVVVAEQVSPAPKNSAPKGPHLPTV